MISMTRLLMVLAVFAQLGACISTTTGEPKSEPDDAASARQYYQLGARYLRNGSYALARDRLLHALDFDPKMADAHSLLALAYVNLENPRLAQEHYEKAVRYEPDNVDSRNAYAVYLCQKKEYDEAQKQFDHAIAIYENDNAEVMLTNAGVCMAGKPDYELAEEYFRRALKFKASYGEALIQLAALKHQTGNNLHARAFLQRYLATNLASAPVLFLGMQIEIALGDDRAAKDYSKQILRDFTDSPEARFILTTSAS